MAFFDARTVAPDAGRVDPVPAGWYLVVCKELPLSPTEDTLGERINGIFEIVEGVYAGRKLFHGFNMKNKSEKAQEIAHAQMSALCHAVKVLTPELPQQLYNIPFKARIKITPAVFVEIPPGSPPGTVAAEKYAAKNEITAFKDANDSSAGSSAVAVPVSSGVVMPPPVIAPPPAQTQVWANAAPQPWAQPAAQIPAQVQVAAPPAQQIPPGWMPDGKGGWMQDPAYQIAQQVVQTQAPVQAPVQQTQPAPVDTSQGGQVVPPWMQPKTA